MEQNRYAPYLSWLDDKQGEMSELLVEIANVNSGTMNMDGIGAVRDRLAREFAKLKGDPKIVKLDPMTLIDEQGEFQSMPLADAFQLDQRLNLPRKVFLCIHLDTVYEPEHPFQKCRHLGDGRVNGPGVADAKGGAVVMLYALRALEASPFAKEVGYRVFLNSDEEIGSPGSQNYFSAVAKSFDLGMLFEPTFPDGSMVDRRKGSGNFVFVVRGKAAHAGRDFHRGRNAIVAAAQIVERVHSLNRDGSEVTLNVGRIRGGGALNVVPDLATVRVNVRVSDFEQIEWVTAELQRISRSFSNQSGIHVNLEGCFTSPPKLVDRHTETIKKELEECGRLIGIPVVWTHSGGASDGNKLSAAGLPNIDTLGVKGGDIHSDQEYLEVDSLVSRAKLAALLLMRFATKEFSLGNLT